MWHFHERPPSRSMQLLVFFHLRSTPRKERAVEWGYDWSTSGGRRDVWATGLLCTLLVVCAVTIGGFVDVLDLVTLKADLCESRELTLGANRALMRNLTNYYEAQQAASATVGITAAAYSLANETYQDTNTLQAWPGPYELSEGERQTLEEQAREGGDKCAVVTKCVGGAAGFVGEAVGEETCATAEAPCPDIAATALLVEYDASQKSLDLFGNAFDDGNLYDEELAEDAINEATDAINVLVRRINFASSIYVLYMAFLVIVTPPFAVYGAKWSQNCAVVLASFTKPMWIALLVVIWYAHETLQSIVTSSLFRTIWTNFLEDPCWADPTFLVNTSAEISATCTDIVSAHNLFSQASANYRYYGEVENTWSVAVGVDVPDEPFYGDAEDVLLQKFPGNCTTGDLLEAIQPSDGSVNWWALFFNSGALVALLLQMVLAHWFSSWFSILRPLTMYRGRVLIPEDYRMNAALWKEVRDFARLKAVLPFTITTALLVFMLTNLAVASSERGMWKKVLIASVCLAVLQFVLVPAVIWRPADEEYQRPSKDAGPTGAILPTWLFFPPIKKIRLPWT